MLPRIFRTGVILQLAVTSFAHAQHLSVGVTAGTNLTRDFRTIHFSPTFYGSNFASSDSHSLIAGPSLELRLGAGWSAHVEALHRTLQFTDATLQSGGARTNPIEFNVGTWEFPVLAKYTINVSPVRPFLELGPSFRVRSNPNSSNPSNHGITAGAGVAFQAGPLKFAPTLRYTRWARDEFNPAQIVPENSPARPTISNQVELLMNVSYGSTHESRRPFGHKLWIGVIGGAGITGDFRQGGATTYLSQNGNVVIPVPIDRSGAHSYPIGLKLELDATDHLSIEANGLYRKLHFKDLHDVVLTWEIPILLKYRFPMRAVTPFLAAGPSFRATGNLNDSNPSHYGATAQAGAEKVVGRVKLEAGLRYTHWALDSPPANRQDIPYSRTVPNQLEALAAISF